MSSARCYVIIMIRELPNSYTNGHVIKLTTKTPCHRRPVQKASLHLGPTSKGRFVLFRFKEYSRNMMRRGTNQLSR